jgi:thiol-disulfide isomerase/thioredoxin
MSESKLYFFYTIGCGWCKKVMPHIDALNEEGHNILKLDLADGDNKKLAQELKTKYKKQCGTPWFINAETGNDVCGAREKDVLLDWINGKEVPPPPKPKGPMPRPPFHGAKKKEEKEWKEEYKKWADENSHLPNLKSATEILTHPRPKSMPPQPWPNPGMADKEIDKWKEKYEKWLKENSHLPNTIPTEQIINRMKNAPQPPNSPGGSPQVNLQLERRIKTIETKLDKLMIHLGVK